MEAHIEGFPEHRGEYASGSSYGTREQLKEQFPWLTGLTDETLDKCRRIRARQQLVWY